MCLTSGLQGPIGKKGEVGLRGLKGEMGYQGNKGKKGSSGLPGLTGLKGATGQKGVKGDKEERNGGTVYIRWGHDQCPSTTQMVHSGRAGGHNHTILMLVEELILNVSHWIQISLDQLVVTKTGGLICMGLNIKLILIVTVMFMEG